MYLPHIAAEFANNHDLASRLVSAASWGSTSFHRPPWPIRSFGHHRKTQYQLQNQFPPYAAQILGRFQHLSPAILSIEKQQGAHYSPVHTAMLCKMNSKPWSLQAAKPCFHPKVFYLASKPSPPHVAFLQLEIFGRKKRNRLSLAEAGRRNCSNAYVIRGSCGSRTAISCIQYAPHYLCLKQPIVRSWPVDSKCEGARQSTSLSYFFLPHPASPRRSADQYKEDGRKHSQNFSVPDGAHLWPSSGPVEPGRKTFLPFRAVESSFPDDQPSC